ncbi:MAG: BON domain-containing protein [Glaciimonas sp.]|nr:BON domain-containing protein [Glaciimonas sp.]
MIKMQSRWNILGCPFATVTLCALVVLSLQGCVGLMLGGAVVGGLAAIDRRTLGAQTDDKTIAIKGEARIPGVVGSPSHINVTSFNRKVLLTGEVRDEAAKTAAEREAKLIEGVRTVVNELAVGDPSSFSQRFNDTFITSKVKASLLEAKGVFGNAVKVVTERGNVYLMGCVTELEASRTAEIAAGISGVQKVVKVFDYMTENELTQLSTAPRQ